MSAYLHNEFKLEETTIAKVQAAMANGSLSCRSLTQAYLERIKTYDQSTGLNAIILTHPDALAQADRLDDAFRKGGCIGPLHGIPVVVKDNCNTFDLPTSAGSDALRHFQPATDAFVVQRLRAAGAVIMAKANMAEWAFSPYETVSSRAGTTRNAYDLSRVPAGSSGGTATAIAANFSLIGLGTDTGNSIRGPAAHLGLVGLRPSLGLCSRGGIIPLYSDYDTAGPLTRTVADTARLLAVIAAPDPTDPVTLTGGQPNAYLEALNPHGLHAARLGVLRVLSPADATDREVMALFEQALCDLAANGATLIDPFTIADFAHHRQIEWRDTLQQDLNTYLAAANHPPYHSLHAIYASGRYAPRIKQRLEQSLASMAGRQRPYPPGMEVEHHPQRRALRAAVTTAMDAAQVDALVYPSWNYPPRRIDDLQSPHGNNSPHIAPHTGQPAITVPIGFTQAGLPTGLQLLGRRWAEATLIRLAYAYEQSTWHRRPPAITRSTPQTGTVRVTDESQSA